MDRLSKKESKMAELQGANGMDLLLTIFLFVLLFGLKSPWLYYIPDTHANSRGHFSSNLLLPSSMLPMQFTQHFYRLKLYLVYFRYQVDSLLFLFPVSVFLLACHPHNACDHTSFLHSTHTMHVITLPSNMSPMQFTLFFCWGYLCPVYFRYQVHSQLFWFPVSNFSSCIDMSKVFFDLVLWHINHCRLFNAKSIFIHINSSISNNSL